MTVTTNDWDTVSAVHVSLVNQKMLAEKDKLPTTFLIKDEDELVELNGTFSKWQICPGGDGHLIGLSVDIQNLHLQHELFGEMSGNAFWTLFVSLQYVGDNNYTNKTKIMNLVIKDDDSDPTDPVVISRELQPGKDNTYKFPAGLDLDFFPIYKEVMAELTNTLLSKWLSENIKIFRYVFNQVNLNLRINSDDTWKWLKPTYIDYAYTENTSDFSQSIFAVLCMVNNHPLKNQAIAVEEDVIPEKKAFGFLIHEEMYLRELLVPGLLKKFPEAKKEDISIKSFIEGEKHRYEAILKPTNLIYLEDVHYKGKTYHPRLEKAEYGLENTKLVMKIETSTWLLSGTAVGHSIIVQPFHMGLEGPKGKQTIKYVKEIEGHSENNYVTGTPEESIPSWLSILLGVVGLIVGVLIPPLLGIIAIVIAGILVGILEFMNEWNMINGSEAPSVKGLVDNVLNEIKWNNQDIQLEIAEFFGAIRFGGCLL